MSERFRHRWDQKPQSITVSTSDRTPRLVGRWLVVCPRCEGRATFHHWCYRPNRVTCSKCGFVNLNASGYRRWLTEPCCGHTLMVGTAGHLAFLEDYVSASLRERLHWNWAGREYLRRLPKWLCLAKNRAAVLRALKKLRMKLLES